MKKKNQTQLVGRPNWLHTPSRFRLKRLLENINTHKDEIQTILSDIFGPNHFHLYLDKDSGIVSMDVEFTSNPTARQAMEAARQNIAENSEELHRLGIDRIRFHHTTEESLHDLGMAFGIGKKEKGGK